MTVVGSTPDPTGVEDRELAEQVGAAHRALAAAGQDDLVWGHAAVRDPAGRGVWTKAAGWGMGEVTPERVLLVSFDGEVLAGVGPRHIEVHIHLELMRRRPDVGATVHSHAVAAVAFACLDTPLRPIGHDATPFLETGPAGDRDVARFTATGDLVRTPELGVALAAAHGDGNGCLIPGHGLVVSGVDLASAVLHAVLLERACRAQLSALAAGGPRRWSDEDEVVAKRAGLYPPGAARSAYEHLVRRSGAGPDTP